MKRLKLKRGFWYGAVIVFSAVLYFADFLDNQVEKLQDESGLVDINTDEFYNRLENDQGTWGVLFYMQDSPYYAKMENNLNRLLNDDATNLPLYKVNLEEHPELFYDQNLAGTPVFVMYKEGKEAQRVMGKVSTLNLNLIFNRLTK